jgi:hypothetical protein
MRTPVALALNSHISSAIRHIAIMRLSHKFAFISGKPIEQTGAGRCAPPVEKRREILTQSRRGAQHSHPVNVEIRPNAALPVNASIREFAQFHD